MDDIRYSPGQIKFTRKHVLWLIKSLPGLREGYWPFEDSSYTEIPLGKRAGKHKAYFETPVDYGIEIQRRLERCGIDGLILLAIECWGESVTSLASYLRMPERSIRKSRRDALGYVASGPIPRWQDKKDRKGELKRKAESYQEFSDRYYKRS